jgi:GT2 family glycosyltransferase
VILSDMEIKNAKVVCCTQKSKFKDYTLNESIWRYELLCQTHLNNTESLAKRYNQAIDEALEENRDCLILVHDDVILEEDPIPKLEKLFDDYDLVGVAGASKIELKSPALWHLMGGGFQGGHLHGCVQHLVKNDTAFYGCQYEEVVKPASTFGKYPHKVVMIDGVFMALNRKAMEEMRFDEDCPSKFHFYDLLASLDFHLKGGRVGVGDILITHESPGLREFTDEWKAGEKYFLEKYK